MSVAAYVFEKTQAERFERDWTRRLGDYGLPFAHQTDCATGNGHYRQMNIGSRIAVASTLIQHIRHRSLFGVSVAVDPGHYEEQIDGRRYELQAYTFCIAGCVTLISNNLDTLEYRGGEIDYVFEAGHRDQTQAMRIMNALPGSELGLRYRSHEFVGKLAAPALQAADMLAWQHAHWLRRQIEGHTVMRRDFAALIRPRDRIRQPTHADIVRWFEVSEEENQELLNQLRAMNPPEAVYRYAAEGLMRASERNANSRNSPEPTHAPAIEPVEK